MHYQSMSIKMKVINNKIHLKEKTYYYPNKLMSLLFASCVSELNVK